MLTKKQGKELLEILIKENDYAEIYLEHVEWKSFDNFDNKRFAPSTNWSRGTSFRTWKGKEVEFLSIDAIDYKTLKEKALEITKKGKGKIIDFQKDLNHTKENDFGTWTPLKIKEKLEKVVKIIKQHNNKIFVATSSLSTTTKTTQVINSDGVFAKRTNLQSLFFATATAKKDNESQETNYQLAKAISFDKLMKLLETNETKEGLDYAANLVIRLLDAPKIKSGKMNVILPSGYGAVLFHEAIGHPLEATQVAKGISIFTKKINEKIASNLVTLIDDGTIEEERGTTLFDDEGTPNQKRVLIEKGILKNFLIDKYNGRVLMNQKENGTGRRQSFRYMPTSRMSNTYIENGTSTVEEIIKSTKHGFYAKQLSGGQVDPFTGQFNFGVTEGYLIKNGKIQHLVKNATLIGNGIDAVTKIDMIANDLKISEGICGSTSGMIPVTVGQPTLRVTDMTVGGK